MVSGVRVTAADMDDAEERFRTRAEQLAVRLRWLSIGAIPFLAYLSDQPIRTPWFEVVVATAIVYNFAVARSLARGRRGAVLSIGTAVQDSVYVTLVSYLSGGLQSPIAIYPYLAMISVCMRLALWPAIAIGGLYACELALLGWLGGGIVSGLLTIRIAYLFLVAAFVVPLVQEARIHFSDVLVGHSAQRGLLRRLLRLEEEERRRVATELHDRGGGALFSLLHGLRRIREVVHPKDAEAAAEVDRLIGVVERSVQDLRILLADLRPRLLDDLGLAEALRDLLARERALSGLAVSLEVDTEEMPDPQSALALYRVTQEALTNIRRHAQASTAVVRLGQTNGRWRLTVEDDGVGVRSETAGLGLRTMRERVEALGGGLAVEPGGRGGTRVAAEVPRHVDGE
jgi:signal transduction histidine kinase